MAGRLIRGVGVTKIRVLVRDVWIGRRAACSRSCRVQTDRAGCSVQELLLLPLGVTGNTSASGAEESRFDPWRGNYKRVNRFGWPALLFLGDAPPDWSLNISPAPRLPFRTVS